MILGQLRMGARQAKNAPLSQSLHIYVRLIATKAHKLRAEVALQMRERISLSHCLKSLWMWQSCVFTMHISCK